MQPRGSPRKASLYPTHLQNRDKRGVSRAFINTCRSTLRCPVHRAAERLALKLFVAPDASSSPLGARPLGGDTLVAAAGAQSLPLTFILHLCYATGAHSAERCLIVFDASGFCCSWTLSWEMGFKCAKASAAASAPRSPW